MSSSTEVEDLTHNPKAPPLALGIWLLLAITVAEYLNHNPTIKGSNPGDRIWCKSCIGVRLCPCSTEVETLNHYPKMRGSNPGESSPLIA
jgi:hypothetical protein